MEKILKISESDYNFIKILLLRNCLATVYKEAYYRLIDSNKTKKIQYDYKYNTIVCLVNRIDRGKTFKECLDIK